MGGARDGREEGGLGLGLGMDEEEGCEFIFDDELSCGGGGGEE